VRTGDGPLTGVTQVAVGPDIACARLANTEARCWGIDTTGQDGNPFSGSSLAHPVMVNFQRRQANVAQLDLGDDHACARLRTGQARCWGNGASDGQLGDDTFTPRDLPRVVVNAQGTGPLTGVASIRTGAAHTCALLGNRQVRCWGANSNHQLGDGTDTSRGRPVAVVVAI
jgi:alpha-tubulin suppressor-like RCC1 family protein